MIGSLKGLSDTDSGDLTPGQTYIFPGIEQIRIPKDVRPGTYYFGILVDRSNRVDESDESNNYVSVRIGIVSGDRFIHQQKTRDSHPVLVGNSVVDGTRLELVTSALRTLRSPN